MIVSFSNKKEKVKISENELTAEIMKNLKKNISLNDLSKNLAIEFEIPKRRIYQLALEIKK